MKIVKPGKLPQDRAFSVVKKWTSRVVCGCCQSTLEFNANDLQSYCVPGKLKVVCPMCNTNVEIDKGGLPQDVALYHQMVRDGYWPPYPIGIGNEV